MKTFNHFYPGLTIHTTDFLEPNKAVVDTKNRRVFIHSNDYVKLVYATSTFTEAINTLADQAISRLHFKADRLWGVDIYA